MRDYGIVSPKFWIGRTGRILKKKPNAQRVGLYLMTGPFSDMTGVFYCPLLSILTDVGILQAPSMPLQCPLAGLEEQLSLLKEALKDLQDADFCYYDYDTEFVFVKEMARWQVAEKLKKGDKRVVGIKKAVNAMPEPISTMFIERYNNDFCLGYDIKGESPFNAPSMPLRSQEQEQEQEQEQDHINTNKHTTEIRYGEATGPDPVCLENSLRENIQDFRDNSCDETKFKDDDSILTPLEIIKLCSYNRLKVARTQKLIEVSNSGTVSVGMVKQCIDITKASNGSGAYFVGCLANAIHEPDRYLTTIQKIRRSAQKEKEAEQFLLEHGDEVF